MLFMRSFLSLKSATIHCRCSLHRQLQTYSSPILQRTPKAVLSIPARSEHNRTSDHRKMSRSSSSVPGEKFVLAYYVPTENSKSVTAAIHATGAGTWPRDTYGETCFVTKGLGQFRKSTGTSCTSRKACSLLSRGYRWQVKRGQVTDEYD